MYYLSETYYIPIVLIVVCLTTALLGYYRKHKFVYLRLFPAYAMASAIQIVISLACVFFVIPTFQLIINYTNVGFVIIEFFIFYDLLFQIIRNKHLKRIMQLMQILFIILSTYIFVNYPIFPIPLLFNIINSFLLLIPCLFFFYEVFNTTPSTSLANQPAFWIVTGFAFMIICTLPFYFLETFFLNNMPDLYNRICTLNYVFYCLLFFLICRAYLCKPTIII